MRGRIASSVIVAAAVLIGTAGCNLVAPQSTAAHYYASDGVSTDSGAVAIRNAMIISADGSVGNLVFTVTNDGDSDTVLRVQYTSGGAPVTERIELAAKATEKVGTHDADQKIILQNMNANPGSLTSIYFQAGNADGREVLVPVLDGALPEYADLVPTAVPTPVPTVG